MRGVGNPDFHPALDQQRIALEKQLHDRYANLDKAAFRSIPAIRAYNEYYARYAQTYHVQLQLESVVLKGRSVARGATLVQAMFMAELKNLLLTAGHDLQTMQGPVSVDVATGSESYTMLNRREQALKQGDMFMGDELGVISSVLYGPDARTQIKASTGHVLFAVYAPAGIGAQAVKEHLTDLAAYVHLVTPTALVESLDAFDGR